MGTVRVFVIGLVALGLIALFAVRDGGAQLAGGVDGPTIFVASETWSQSVTDDEAASRTAALTTAITEVRADTGSGWVGRQDDVTGYLSELDGGYFRGQAQAPAGLGSEFLDAWGPQLFGVDGAGVRFNQQEPAGRNLVVLRGEQRVGDVPVLDGELTVMVAGDDEPSLTSLRGRLFPDVKDVDTEPDVPAERARRVALGAAALRDGESTVQGEPTLVIFPRPGGGVLVWRVIVMGGAQGEVPSVDAYFVDATNAELVATRAQSIPHANGLPAASVLATAARQTPPDQSGGVQGQPVSVTGTGATGEPLHATALQQPDGSIVLVDPTAPWYDPSTGTGLVATFDGSGIDPGSGAGFPGQVVTSPTAQIDDPEALSAHAQHRYILDYYQQVFGRSSWDGTGGGLTGIVRFPVECNAFFNGFIDPPVMAYGPPCGAETTMLDMDISAHEVTHGITHTTARLLYHGQSGALNESFSDYFGNVMGDDYYGRASSSQAETSCAAAADPTPLCDPHPTSGELAGRHFDLDVGLGDYLQLLTPPFLASSLQGVWSDNGGVHLNSGIWNSALWTIRSRLAAVDGGDMLNSTRVRMFDQIVYRALTQHLTATSGFVEARSALEEAASASGAEAVIVDTIREVLDAKDICAGCVTTAPSAGTPIATSTATEQVPVVTDAWTAWLDFQESEALGRLVVQTPSGPPTILSETALAFAPVGDNLLVIEDDLATSTTRIVVYDADGTSRILQQGLSENEVFPDVAGSDALGAWLSDAAYAVDATGRVSSAPIPDGLEPVTFAMGAGEGTVALGTTDGEVYVWRPAEGGQFRLAGQVEGGRVVAVDAYGDRVVAIAAPPQVPFGGILSVLDVSGDGQATILSENAMPWTVSLTRDHVVWAEAIDALSGGVAEELARTFSRVPDSDLYLHAFAADTTYRLTNQPGQQGIPSLVGRHLAWVDAAAGGNDVYYSTLPDGL